MYKEIALTQGKFVTVDDADYEWLNQWKWIYNPPNYEGGSGYAYRSIKQDGKWVPTHMHAVIMNPPPGMVVDHIDRNGLNNCRSNLRIATPSQNLMNARPRKGTSQFKGIYYRKKERRWVAAIYVNKKRIRLGSFAKEIDAAQAYNEAAQQYFGEFALLNNLQDTPLSELPTESVRKTTSSYPGVYFSKNRRRWIARISINKRLKHLGTFLTEGEAIAARQDAETS